MTHPCPNWIQIEFGAPKMSQIFGSFQKCISWITFATFCYLLGWRAGREESESAIKNTFYFSSMARPFVSTHLGAVLPWCVPFWPKLGLWCALACTWPSGETLGGLWYFGNCGRNVLFSGGWARYCAPPFPKILLNVPSCWRMRSEIRGLIRMWISLGNKPN